LFIADIDILKKFKFGLNIKYFLHELISGLMKLCNEELLKIVTHSVFGNHVCNTRKTLKAT